MSRSERWNTKNEIRRRFHLSSDPVQGAGPVVYYENGKKYTDDGESHIAVIGRTGKGKSQCCSLPFERECLMKGESLIVLDPKGEGYRRNACYIPEGYQNFCVDLRNPRNSRTRWNPLSMPYRLFNSKDPDDHDIASSMLSELWSGVYPIDVHADRFWPEAAANYAKGLTYAMFETLPKEHINLDTVAVMMDQSEIRIGGDSVLKAFYSFLPLDSLARRNLASYVTGPNDTRASIHSVAASGLEVFSRSKGLMEMLSEDTLNIMDIDVTRPFILTIITPDETDVYDTLSGLLVSQFTQHLIRVAQDCGGRLPIRVNVILEELGSVGAAISQLPKMMVASRSRNIRLMLVLQSGSSQLIDIYGKSKAETINSCIGITFGFSTNSWETLNEWAQRCGERQTENGSQIVKEQLITASQLAAMPTGTALVMVDNVYKYIAHFPFFDEMYGNSDWRAPDDCPVKRTKARKSFDFEKYVKELKMQKAREQLGARETGRSTPFGHWGSESHDRPSYFDPFGIMPDEREELDPFRSDSDEDKASENPSGSDSTEDKATENPDGSVDDEDDTMDFEELIEQIDARIAELNREEEEARKQAEQKKKEGKKKTAKYDVHIISCKMPRGLVINTICRFTDNSPDWAYSKLRNCPTVISGDNEAAADILVKMINKDGGKAFMTKHEAE